MKPGKCVWLTAPAAGAVALATILTACGTTSPAGSTEPPDLTEFRMAFVPSQIGQQVLDNAQPLADIMSKKTGWKFTAQVSTNYAAVTAAMTAKNIEVGWTGPLDYVIAHEKNGAIPLTKSVRRDKPGYKAFVIVPADSPARTLADLKGKKFAFGDPVSTSSSLYPKYFLKLAGVDPERDLTAQNISNQTAVALAVYNKQVDAGAIYDDARENRGAIDRFPDIKQKTRVLKVMPGDGPDDLIPGDPQMIRKDINSRQREKIRQALIELADDPAGAKYLKDLYTIQKLVRADDTDYKLVRDVLQQVSPGLLKSESPSPSVSPSR
jgi:phosphonate transport system substrate-binding protein